MMSWGAAAATEADTHTHVDSLVDFGLRGWFDLRVGN
jgi:hypothetical protein